ncbi:FKBP-type peptidyl-prolyl cis-trans isomerase [Candidatus Saccharibacteria bacterium]|nr:FKBP-type peptidyl-prolyl cis-trans isomerase [Candidatus Saccharibacteria bacterium]
MRDKLRRLAWGFMAVVFVLTGVVFSVIIFFQNNNQKDNTSQNQPDKLVGTKMPNFQSRAKVDQLEIQDIAKGSGQVVKDGSTVTLQYLGARSSDGLIFDTTLDQGQAATFQLSKGSVIDGFRQGLIGMKVGGSRNMWIPAALGYGAAGAGQYIPPNTDLFFQVSLQDVK